MLRTYSRSLALMVCSLLMLISPTVSPIQAAQRNTPEKIAFISGDTFDKMLSVMDADGKNAQVLAPTLDDTYCSRCSPDGQHILYTSRGQIEGEVYSIDAEGKNPVRVTDSGVEATLNHGPAFSPDGKQIVFGDALGNQGLYVMDTDGGNKRRILAADITFLAWSPDGKQIAFVGLDGGLCSIDPEGENVHRLNIETTTSVFFAWSPDAKQIAFVGLDDNDHAEHLFLINADGSNQKSLSDRVYSTESLTWSPDGKRIVFVGDRDGHRELYAIGSDGQNLIRLTKTGDDIWNVSPVYSPDGAQIAYVVAKNNIKQIYVMDADGKNSHALTQKDSNTCPPWQPQPQ